MKFSLIAETRKKIAEKWEPQTLTEYIVKIPNYVSVNTDALVVAITKRVEKHVKVGEDTKVVSYNMYGDSALTNFEKKNLDFTGTINKPVEIPFNKLDLDF